MSLAKPLVARRLAFMPSVNMAGSRLEAPYTAALDFTTSLRTSGDCWHAASSCMVPMTLSSFIEVLPPAAAGVAATLVCTTVSTRSRTITFAMTGLRMSARTKSALPRSPRGGTTSTPMTRSTSGDLESCAAKRRPRSPATPVTSTTWPMVAAEPAYLPRRRRCTRVFFSSLRCFFFAMRLRRFLMTEPTFDLSVSARDGRGHPVRRAQPNGRDRAQPNRRQRSQPVACRTVGRVACRGPSAGVEEAALEVLVDVVLAHAKGPSDAHSRDLTVVDEAVHSHLGDAHHRSNFCDGQELHLGDVSWPVRGHGAPHFLFARPMASSPRTPRAHWEKYRSRCDQCSRVSPK